MAEQWTPPGAANPELRQKPTVKAGIIWDEEEPPNGRTVVYEPGNGSRYVLHLTEVRPSERLRKEMAWQTWKMLVVVDLLQGTAATLPVVTDAPLVASRLAAQLQRGPLDGMVLAELVAHLTGLRWTP